MNNVERLAALFGGKGELAEVAGVDPSLVSRWVKDGNVPQRYNRKVREAARDRGVTVEPLLLPDVCPTCGQAIDDGTVTG